MTNQCDTIRIAAGAYAGVDQGTACTQDSFKVGGKAFLFIGPQGGRWKAMFKLDASRDEALALADQHPNDFQVGKGVWVTARFSDDAPLDEALWKRWLAESYALSGG